MVHRRGLVFGFGLGWTPVPSIGSYGLGSGFFFFATGEERDGAPERGTAVGLGWTCSLLLSFNWKL
jgi:hypothetical protein